MHALLARTCEANGSYGLADVRLLLTLSEINLLMGKAMSLWKHDSG